MVRFWRALDTFTYFFVERRIQKLLQQLGKERSRFRWHSFDRVAAILDKVL
jgi:hypothetical protein